MIFKIFKNSIIFFFLLTTTALADPPRYLQKGFFADLASIGKQVFGIAQIDIRPGTGMQSPRVLYHTEVTGTAVQNIKQVLSFAVGYFNHASNYIDANALYLVEDHTGTSVLKVDFSKSVLATAKKIPATDGVLQIERVDYNAFMALFPGNLFRLYHTSPTSAFQVASNDPHPTPKGYEEVFPGSGSTDPATIGNIKYFKWVGKSGAETEHSFVATTHLGELLLFVTEQGSNSNLKSSLRWKQKIAGPGHEFKIIQGIFATPQYILVTGLDHFDDTKSVVYTRTLGQKLFSTKVDMIASFGINFFSLPGDNSSFFNARHDALTEWIPGVGHAVINRFSSQYASLQVPLVAQQQTHVSREVFVSVDYLQWWSMFGSPLDREPTFRSVKQHVLVPAAAPVSKAVVAASPALWKQAAHGLLGLIPRNGAFQNQFRVIEDARMEKRSFREVLDAALKNLNKDAGRDNAASILAEKRPLVLENGKTTLGDFLYILRMLRKYGVHRLLVPEVIPTAALEERFGVSIDFKYDTIGPALGHDLTAVFDLEKFYAAVEEGQCSIQAEI